MRLPLLGLLLLLPSHLPRHFLLNAVQNQFGLFFDDVAVVLVADFYLEGVEESKLVVGEGVVEFVAVVYPALANHWNFLLEQLIQLLLLFLVVLSRTAIQPSSRRLLAACPSLRLFLAACPSLRPFRLFHEVVGPYYYVLKQVLSLGDSSARAAPIFLALLIVLLLFSFWPSPKKNWNL